MDSIAITGSGSGLGKSLALQYAKAGHYIYLLGRNDEKLLVTKKQIEENGGKATNIVCDVTEPASVNEAFKQIDTLNVLINNAGVGIFGSVSDYSPNDIALMLDTNIKGTILVTQAGIPLIKASSGRILNIISTAGLRGKTNESVYCASKFAQRGFTESLQKEFQGQDICITAVYMGGMDTPFWHNSTHISDRSRLKAPNSVAEEIFNQDDGRNEINIGKN